MLFEAVTALAGARTNAEAIAAEDQSVVLTTNERTVLSSALVSM